jgi:hypothetical protein
MIDQFVESLLEYPAGFFIGVMYSIMTQWMFLLMGRRQYGSA